MESIPRLATEAGEHGTTGKSHTDNELIPPLGYICMDKKALWSCKSGECVGCDVPAIARVERKAFHDLVEIASNSVNHVEQAIKIFQELEEIYSTAKLSKSAKSRMSLVINEIVGLGMAIQTDGTTLWFNLWLDLLMAEEESAQQPDNQPSDGSSGLPA